MSWHTPGPWRADDYGNVFADDDQMHVAEVRGWGRLTGTGGGLGLSYEYAEAIQNANALLIAAAPDLLTALAHICEMQARNYGDGVSTHMELIGLAERARAAIAKATGSEVPA